MSPASSLTDDVEVVKWYTRARRFPKLVGKMSDGRSIWGGPYTHTQVVAFAAIWVVGSQTTGLWAHFGVITNVLVLIVVSAVTVVALGRLPMGARNPLRIMSGAVRAVNGPSTGRYAGRPLRSSRPHRVRSRVVVSALPVPAQLAAAEELPPPADQGHTTSTNPEPAVVAMSGVQALLAAQTTKKG